MYILHHESLSSQDARTTPRLERLRCRRDSPLELLACRLRDSGQQCLRSLHSEQIFIFLFSTLPKRNAQRTGSTTSVHLSVELSTNSPPMKFFVLPPVALVPFHSAEISSALARAVAESALRGGRVVIVAVAYVRRTKARSRWVVGNLTRRMVVV